MSFNFHESTSNREQKTGPGMDRESWSLELSDYNDEIFVKLNTEILLFYKIKFIYSSQCTLFWIWTGFPVLAAPNSKRPPSGNELSMLQMG